MSIWNACTNALDDPTSHLVHLAMVYGQFLHLCGKIIKCSQFIFYFFYLTNLELLDITSQRKLAHIQRLILRNYHFNSITDNTCRHLSLGNMWAVSTTGPKVILLLFLYFSRTQLLAYSLEKYLHLVSRTKTYHYTTHTWMRMTILACWTALQQLPSLIKSMFSHLSDE